MKELEGNVSELATITEVLVEKQIETEVVIKEIVIKQVKLEEQINKAMQLLQAILTKKGI